ncbi:O-antigen ligase family protein [Flavobacterium sp. KBS0721]|uniref:O-antigen ligase family protein n=1 Tax=Flavobacterium sp. KBS0721 TaxID=1179672 RepID=UPI00098F6B3C|nr:O-antigen ligase family protein [Flavobacterium sp. KBS0721]QDW21056.1 hypothetical protein B0M43_0013320 [Flavobacterium sp. KBS0721]
MNLSINRITALANRNLIGVAALGCIVLSHLNLGYFIPNLPDIQPYISFATLILAPIQLVVLIFSGKSLGINLIDTVVALFYGYISANNLILGYYFFNSEFIDFSAVFLVYFLIRTWNGTQSSLFSYLRYVAVLIITIESLYCILQFTRAIINLNPHYAIGGSYGHPGFTAASISVLLPYYINPSENKSIKATALQIAGPFLWIVLLLFFLESRSAVLSMILSFAAFIVWPEIKKSIRIRMTVALFFFAAILATATIVKRDSSLGRIFIWKKCMAMIPENLFFGYGFGQFAFEYNNYQSHYFSSDAGSDKESSLAEYCESAFNEFLQFGVEMGLTGIILFCMVLGSLFCYAGRTSNAHFYNAALLSYLPLFFGWSVLRYFPLGCFFFIALALLSKEIKPYSYFKFGTQKYAVLPVLICFTLYFSFNRIMFFNAHMDIRDKRRNDYSIRLKDAYDVLLYSDSYIYQYSAFLIQSNQYKKAAIVCESSSAWLNSPALYHLLFQVHFELDQFEKAQKDLDYLVHISPSKIYPKYALAKLFYARGERLKGDSLARKILDIKPKIVNADVILMREELKLGLKNEVKPNATK